MLELAREAAIALQSEADTYPQGVQIWMKVMAASFFAGIFFAYSKVGARWIFAALLLNILGLVIGKIVFPEESRTAIGTYVHILFWPPTLWATWRAVKQLSFSPQFNNIFDWVYIVWLVWASVLIIVSLAFDFRTLLFMWI
jgi:hypothetical protein